MAYVAWTSLYRGDCDDEVSTAWECFIRDRGTQSLLLSTVLELTQSMASDLAILSSANTSPTHYYYQHDWSQGYVYWRLYTIRPNNPPPPSVAMLPASLFYLVRSFSGVLGTLRKYNRIIFGLPFFHHSKEKREGSLSRTTVQHWYEKRFDRTTSTHAVLARRCMMEEWLAYNSAGNALYS